MARLNSKSLQYEESSHAIKIHNKINIAQVLLTLSNVKFYLDESIIAPIVMWNHLDSNIWTDDIIQCEFIPPQIPVVITINSITSQQAELQYRLVTKHLKYSQSLFSNAYAVSWATKHIWSK